jgi:membrane protein YdbS with pleckstrin-like domain
MNTSANRIRTDTLVAIGIGIGLVVAVIVDQTIMYGMSDRPVVLAVITGIVAVLWMAVVQLFLWPTPAHATVTHRKDR